MSQDDHNTRTSKGALLVGFTSIVILLLAISFLSIYTLKASVSNLQEVTEATERQENLLNTMHNSARDRIITLYQMSIADDPFYRDSLWLQFNARGTGYITSRNELYSLEIDETLRMMLQEQDKILMPLGRIQLDIADELHAGNDRVARQLLIAEASPLQKNVLEYFHGMGEIIEENNAEAIQHSLQRANTAKGRIILFSALALMLTLFVAMFVFRRVHSYEQHILKEKERAQVTLHSIVDGVVIINNQGVIIELNDAALNMLGQSKDDVLNRHLDKVIKVHKQDKDEIPSPLDLASVLNAEVMISDGGVELIKNDHDRLIIEYSFSPIIIDNKVSSAVLVMHDITTMHALAQKLDYEATHDSLTGIINRRKFEELLAQTLSDAKRYTDTNTWLCYIDLDHFKKVNDTCGHLAGDQFLVQVANRISGAVRETDHVARMGGDEFAVILRYSGKEEALAASERIRQNIGEMEFVCGDHHFDVTASLGLVSLDQSVHDVNAALNHVDKACYQSKHAGRNQLAVYESD
jgi:diguanylate cyclase (GGDEF)-like protein/PAS domain S-box-containing protein